MVPVFTHWHCRKWLDGSWSKTLNVCISIVCLSARSSLSYGAIFSDFYDFSEKLDFFSPTSKDAGKHVRRQSFEEICSQFRIDRLPGLDKNPALTFSGHLGEENSPVNYTPQHVWMQEVLIWIEVAVSLLCHDSQQRARVLICLIVFEYWWRVSLFRVFRAGRV